MHIFFGDDHKWLTRKLNIDSAIAAGLSSSKQLLLEIVKFELDVAQRFGRAQIRNRNKVRFIISTFGNDTQIGSNDIALKEAIRIVISWKTRIIAMRPTVAVVPAFNAIPTFHDAGVLTIFVQFIFFKTA